jgi:UDP-GlcNAc:undecaprenyl-phosphate GlcNAc-1-phosphate transferase
MGSYLVIMLCACLVTAATTPLVRRLANDRQWVAVPDERKVHKVPMPDVGGIAMFVGVVVSLLVAWRMGQFTHLFVGNSEPAGVVIGAFIILCFGVRDDIKEISAPARVIGTVLSALVLVYFGVTMFYFRLPFIDVFQVSNDWTPIVTVVWLLMMTQAINLIDGLDGLAAGIVAIASGTFFIYSQHLAHLGLLSEPNLGPLIAAITVGVCVGFLPFNFNPASIFMGDGGAYLLGFLLAVSTSVVGGRADPATQAFSGQTYFFLAPLFIPIMILGVPIFDVVFAIIRRVSRGEDFSKADRGHLHHRLINLGHGPRRAVVILWGWTILLSGFVMFPVFRPSTSRSLAVFGIIAIVLILYTTLHPDLHWRNGKSDESEN